MISDSSKTILDRPPRERILLTAHDLFYRDGIRATGIDKVIAESGVTKVTFYRYFPSKNDLIRAFLDFRHEGWMAWFRDAIQRHGGRVGSGLMPLVAAMAEWFRKPIYRGCAFINTVAELGGVLPDVVEICHQHKQDMVRVIAELLPDGPNRLQLANAAAVAIDGAIVKAQLESQDAEEKQSLQSLETLLIALDAFAESTPAVKAPND
ncbi:TetR family transcriptional regulator [Methylomonas methanica]|uniref:TetR family transcriptional regulator n=2 Tax=Methylomonas TaxID=416 RepID=A0A126T229_9GAMM|nr:TetR/AcrR family transcriptional regulator [Methylomonas methanica]AMK76128.1 TetR family transcriptional regulator [Methylomonas denitrificans]OAH96085.1 TetR family transcriptional regulator [Methylomonas methanica]TCV81375.1 TetR family transcriptional regulator [Methylomonas methanica]